MNQTPEQLARDHIDQQLEACGWKVQDKMQVNLAAGLGVAIREYQTDIGPADYVLFVDKKPVVELQYFIREIFQADILFSNKISSNWHGVR